ncbi:MAG: hypothetical protein CVU91_00100 [Firmicutes bacterium HGW-Firmicutes-16]|nr:MAG: hypothetical protein CVU91_00100 [Firmicutes bacterium HGW-Firmicutes-16]
MRRINCIFIVVLFLALLCSCGNEGHISASGSPSGEATGTSSASPTDITGETATPAPTPMQSTAVDNDERFNIFRSFLSDNYQELSDAFFNGISGIGFIDLDLDGGVEMLMFDAGASAAMGLAFFDIVDDKVECVSANMDAVGEAFGGDHLSKVIVNANRFDDFRLMQDKKTGEKFFIVESGNGAADFSYNELVRFGNDGDFLTLKSLMYEYDEYDADTGVLVSASFRLAGKSAEKDEYDAAYKEFFDNAEELPYTAMGAFLWEKDDYGAGLDGLLAMADKARLLYYANSFYIV